MPLVPPQEIRVPQSRFLESLKLLMVTLQRGSPEATLEIPFAIAKGTSRGDSGDPLCNVTFHNFNITLGGNRNLGYIRAEGVSRTEVGPGDPLCNVTQYNTIFQIRI